MNDFIDKYDLFTMNMMGMGEKPRNIYKSKKQRKNPPFGYPPIPPSIELSVNVLEETRSCLLRSKNMFRLDESIFGVW